MNGVALNLGGQTTELGIFIAGPTVAAFAARAADGSITLEETALTPTAESKSAWRRIPLLRAILLSRRDNTDRSGLVRSSRPFRLGLAIIPVLTLVVGPYLIAQHFGGGVATETVLRALLLTWVVLDRDDLMMRHSAEHRGLIAAQAGRPLDRATLRATDPAHPLCGSTLFMLTLFWFTLAAIPLGFIASWAGLAVRALALFMVYYTVGDALRFWWSPRILTPMVWPSLVWQRRMFHAMPPDAELDLAIAAVGSVVRRERVAAPV